MLNLSESRRVWDKKGFFGAFFCKKRVYVSNVRDFLGICWCERFGGGFYIGFSEYWMYNWLWGEYKRVWCITQSLNRYTYIVLCQYSEIVQYSIF